MNLLTVAHPSTAAVIGVIVSLVIPFLSSLLSRAHWDSFVTGCITLALATANGFFTEWLQAGHGFAWQAALAAALTSYVIAVVTRLGLLKGTAVDARLLAVGSKPPAPTT